MGVPERVRLCFASCVGRRQRDELSDALRVAGHEVANGAADEHELDPRVPSVVVFETALGEAIELVRAQSAHVHERVLVVALAADRGVSSAFSLIAAGASDVLAPAGDTPVAARVAARLTRWRAVDALLATEAVARTLVGTSSAWNRVLRQIVEVARFTDAPILITGETGTGKELVSRLVHALDARSTRRDFVVLDCTTIVPELSGSEFFGHEKGSFTGALAARNGAFALADGGTLFLDEVGELPLVLQAELLRVVQERTYKRIGGSLWQTTSFRLVCATNRELGREQDEGRFRADLYYRISGWTFHLPPLRERREDIPPLVRHFLGEHLATPAAVDDAVMQYLVQREFRGNIRELRQICARIAHRHVGPGPITIGDLGADLVHGAEPRGQVAASGATAGEPGAGEPGAAGWCDPLFRRSIGKAVEMGVGLKEIGRLAEDIAVRLALDSENGSLPRAARRLGVTDRALQLRRASTRASDPALRALPGDKLG
ncbi:MAG TPA: sigma 54-interacting transcriptional regulator [Kofleriaceae bacterium]|nr:sigma 54-interacting transcriptional regulator [Kofleriaceae bacterium]